MGKNECGIGIAGAGIKSGYEVPERGRLDQSIFRLGGYYYKAS